MKRYSFILILSLIFTDYLFPQSEEKETIEMYTLTKIDTTIVGGTVNEQEKQTDLSKCNFYNDYLTDLKKTNSTSLDTVDTLAINNCKKTGVISAKLGSLILVNTGFITWDIPIVCETTIVAKCFYGVAEVDGGGIFKGFGLGAGFVSKQTGNVIIRGNICPTLIYGDNEKTGFMINIGTDVILWKVFSVGLDSFIALKGSFILPTVGLNIVY